MVGGVDEHAEHQLAAGDGFALKPIDFVDFVQLGRREVIELDEAEIERIRQEFFRDIFGGILGDRCRKR